MPNAQTTYWNENATLKSNRLYVPPARQQVEDHPDREDGRQGGDEAAHVDDPGGGTEPGGRD